MADNPQTQTEENPAPAQAPPPRPPEAAHKPTPKKEEAPRPRKSLGRKMREHPIKLLIVLLILAGAAYGGVRLMNYFESYESTDDAQIDGDIYAITSRIAGTVKAVHVEDNQAVKAGDLLVELDPADYDVALSQTKAALSESQSLVAVARPNVPLTTTTTETTLATSATAIAQARAAVAGAQRDYDSAVADIRRAEADSAKAQADLERYKQLIAKDEISKQQYDTAEAAAKSAAANVDAKRATAEAAQRTIEENQARLEESQTRQVEAQSTRPQQIAIQDATVKSREASATRQRTLVDQALLNLSYTKIFAPVDGIIGKKNAEPGQQIAAGQQLMADVPVGNIWVTANFKETQLKKMRPNQRVTIHVDSYDRDYDGYVESVAGATGARFSLLPPENATGNYVKVVQRVPVRIRFKEGQDPNHQLRPGMSVDPKVWLE
jgi:membrane fusion protein (multidrug efflux system)